MSSVENKNIDPNEILILCVRDLPNIYNKNRDDFKDATKKIRSWNIIAKTVSKLCFKETKVKEVQARWKTLRESYSTQHKKIKQALPSGSGQQVEEFTWPYYRLMSFLEPQVEHEPSDSNYAMVHTSKQSFIDQKDSAIKIPATASNKITGKLQKFVTNEELLQETQDDCGDDNHNKDDDFRNLKKLKNMLYSQAKAEEDAITKSEGTIKEVGKSLMSIMSKELELKNDARFDSFQHLLALNFQRIPENKKLNVFNQLINIIDSEVHK